MLDVLEEEVHGRGAEPGEVLRQARVDRGADLDEDAARREALVDAGQVQRQDVVATEVHSTSA